MWIHRLAGTSILIITLTLGLLAIKKLDWKLTSNPHNVIGFIVMVWVGLISFGGIFARSRLNRARWNTKFALRIKKMHKVKFFVVIKFIVKWISDSCSGSSLYPYWRFFL